MPTRLSNYPGPGDVALLCEGDLAGYESAVLRRWREAAGLSALLDVHPCGTRTALSGMADAIGRAVPVVVIEDRDFRSDSQVTRDCEITSKDRRARGVKLGGWMAWTRCEIENYFLDDDVILPVFSATFRCSSRDVLDARQEAVDAYRLFNAVKQAQAACVAEWKEIEQLQYHFAAPRPIWDDGSLEPRDHAEVQRRIDDAIKQSQRRATPDREPFSCTVFSAAFRDACDALSAKEVHQSAWLTAWCGKEILQATRKLLAARFAPPETIGNPSRERIRWSSSKELKATHDALDRELERSIQPRLIAQLFEVLPSNPSYTLHQDLRVLRQHIEFAVS
jgi:hypothetical protein